MSYLQANRQACCVRLVIALWTNYDGSPDNRECRLNPHRRIKLGDQATLREWQGYIALRKCPYISSRCMIANSRWECLCCSDTQHVGRGVTVLAKYSRPCGRSEPLIKCHQHQLSGNLATAVGTSAFSSHAVELFRKCSLTFGACILETCPKHHLRFCSLHERVFANILSAQRSIIMLTFHASLSNETNMQPWLCRISYKIIDTGIA